MIGTMRYSADGLVIVESGDNQAELRRVAALLLSGTGSLLNALTLSAATIAENSAAGTVVGSINGTTAGSTLSLVDDAGGRFAISGGNLVAGATATDYEASTSHNVTIRETLAGYGNSPRDTTRTISVTNVFEQPNLSALALSSTSFTIGTPASGSITGATAGSTITASGLPTGLTINGAARTWAYDGTGTAATTDITLTETLADSSNSPRSSVISVTLTSAPSIPIASVNTEGWTGEWSSGTPPTFTPDSSPVTFSVTRQGFDATGAATNYSGTRTFTRRQRQVYPNQASDTATTVALDDYVYSTDSIAGVTNNSTVSSPKPVAAWVMPGRQMVGNSLHWELVAFHRDARLGRQVACVVVTATDGTITVSQTVSGSAISTLCSDANPVEVFQGDIDITSLATGLITLNAKVYPWIGDNSAILDSSTNGTVREFSPRHFLKNVARLASPPLAYVDATSGNDSTGVWSTTPATASATPFATIGGAVGQITTQSAATGGIADGCRIRIKTAGSAPGSVTTGPPQNVAAIVIEGDPAGAGAVTWNTSLRLKIPNTGLTSPLTESAIRYEGLTFNRTVSTATFFGESTCQAQISLVNCTVDNTTTSSWLSNAHDYFFGLTITGYNGQLGQTTNQHRLMRGLVADFNGGIPEGWVTVGCAMTRAKSVGYADPTKGAIHYSNKYFNPDSTAAPIGISANNAGDTVSGFVVVQNLIEVLHTTTSTPGLRGPSSDAPQHGNSLHAIFAHNTITGYGSVGRSNIFYDNNSSTEVRTHALMRDIGNIYVQLNTKGDVFVAGSGADPTDAPLHVGQFAYHHGVGCQGNFSMFAVNAGTAFSENQAYAGLGSNIGTDAAVRNDPLFTNYQGTGGSGGTPTAGAGGGTYTLQSGSPAKSIVTRAVLAYDIAGTARGTGNQNAGAYAG